MKAIVGICAIAALGLAGCGSSSNDFVAGPADPTPTTDPFGNDFGTPIPGLAAFIQAGDPDGPVAAHDEIIVTFNADGSFTVTTPAGDDLVFSGDGVLRTDPVLDDDIIQFTNAAGDVLEVVQGFDATDNLIFDIARVDQADSLAGFELYGVIGNETEAANLPTGTATYKGGFLASIFNAGEAITDDFKGTTTVTANFGDLTVDSIMAGSYVVDGMTFDGNMNSTATLIGSQYTGTFSADVDLPTDLGLPFDFLLVTGDGVLAGAFYGLTGEATAGAFAGRDVDFSNPNPLFTQPVEIVGGFAAGIVPTP